MRKLLGPLLLALALATAAQGQAAPQNPSTMPADESTAKAKQLLDQMVAVLGGPRWTSIDNREQEGRNAGFYHGESNGGYTEIFTTHQGLDHDRIDFTKKRNVVDIIVGRDGWEITFQGRKRMDPKELDDFLRRRDHSLETVMRTWLKQPGVAFFWAGQKMSERRLCDEVTIITQANDSVTLLLDANSHLPRARTFYWRDPEYHDKNEETETYDDWHMADGLPTPFMVTRYHNGEMSRQFFVSKTTYNQPLAPDTFDPDATVRKIAK